MRKILFVLFASIFMHQVSFGQLKHCDLSIGTDKNIYEVPVGDSRDVFVVIKNNGPDTILPTDTIRYKLKGWGFSFAVKDSTIYPGDSIKYAILSEDTDEDQIGNDTIINCLHFLPTSTFKDSITSNDSFCFSVIYQGRSNSGILKHVLNNDKVQIYPNPSWQNKVSLLSSKQLNIEHIRLLDFLGRELVLKIEKKSDYNILIETSTLSEGVYLIMGDFKEGGSFSRRLLIKK